MNLRSISAFALGTRVLAAAISLSFGSAAAKQFGLQRFFCGHYLAIGLTFISFGSTAFAYCPSYPSANEEFNNSPLVFVGRVVSMQELPEPGEFIAATIYTVRVNEVLKGKPTRLTQLFSENTTGRFPMKIGASYLIFAYPETFKIADVISPQLAVNNCGMSGMLPGARKALREARNLRAALNKAPR